MHNSQLGGVLWVMKKTSALRFLALALALATVAAAATPARILNDTAHGEGPHHPEMQALAKKHWLEISDSKAELTPELLASVRLLYLRAPSTAFSEREKAAVIEFVRKGGALLLVLDEDLRQSLAKTGVNDLIAPFGVRLTGDLPYLHNRGGLAIAGEINAANRELPYSGGRAVEGGMPFAFVLDREGKPAEAFATRVKVEGGGRIVVMGEGMASIFLGKPEGVRLTGKDRDAVGTVYWGKDSALFMDEVIAWLVK
ncbi:MAG TPA: hypothetical protein VGD88_17795 [Opitutaceae bacterium]